MNRFAKPAFFSRFAESAWPWVAAATALCLFWGLWAALISSPEDYLQGQTMRIMYIHVPAAWISLFAYVTLGVAGFFSLVWRHVVAGVYVRTMAPVGAVFTLVCLVTGSLWGLPTWGTWWDWDMRMTSVLVLLFLYIGIIAVGKAFEDDERGEKAASILAMVGLINLPIIKFSVSWWNTLHQPASVLRLDGPTIHSSMLYPLFIMATGFLGVFFLVMLWRMRTALIERRLTILRHRSREV